MAAIKLTLQNRITALLVVSSVIFIAIFTFIQLNNQMAQLNRFNAYRSSLSTMITKNNLEAIIRQNPQDMKLAISTGVKDLIDTDMAEDITLFDTDGKVIFSSEGFSAGEDVSYKDSNKTETLKTLAGENKWITSVIDKIRQKIYMYIGLGDEQTGQLNYVAKLTLPLASISEALSQVYQPITFATILVILANIVFGYFLSKTVIGPIKALNKVTKIIAEGDLSVRTNIRTEDELEELGSTFNYMTEELIKMKERAENANPLTKLPGNLVIHDIIENRIKENKQFMVIYCDLDNFKAYNDKYGIAKGDEAIKLTAEVFKEAAKQKGDKEAFVGHEGGDDFILVTSPESAQAVADHITSEFDKRVRSLYDDEDLTRGYIIAHARDGAIKQFPIMTISLAGITNAHRTITSYGEVTNIAAEVKKKAKAIEGSVFVIDKRTS